MAALVLPLAATLTGGCGFQMVAAPLDDDARRIYLQTSSPYSVFSRTFSREVRQRGGELVQSAEDADLTLRILEDSTGQRVLSVSARNIPREYEIFYVLQYSANARNGNSLTNQSLDLQRSYTYDETLVLGKRKEETVLREALAEDLVRQVLRRLESLPSRQQG